MVGEGINKIKNFIDSVEILNRAGRSGVERRWSRYRRTRKIEEFGKKRVA